MPLPDLTKCLSVIKTLEKANERLLKEKESLLKNEQQLQEKIRQFEKANIELQAKEVSVSATSTSGLQTTPVAENVTINKLTCQNLQLRNKLEKVQNSEAVQETVDRSDLQEAIDHYKTIILQKNDEIALLKQNSGSHKLANQVTFLNQFLQRFIAVNNAYSKDILSLQEQLAMLASNNNQETQAQTVSGDQDLVGAVGDLQINSLPNKLQQLKDEIIALKEKNEDLYKKNNQLRFENDSLVAHKLKLEEENEFLRSKNNLLSDSKEFALDSQMKIFLDDFYDERKEKEKQYKENQEMKVENTRLKQRCEALTTLIRTQSIPNRNPTLHHQTSLPQDMYKGSSVELSHNYLEESKMWPNYSSQNESPSYSQTHTSPRIDLAGVSNIQYSNQRFQLSTGLIDRQETPKVIGFSTKFRSPTSPPTRQEVPAFGYTTQRFAMPNQAARQNFQPRLRPVQPRASDPIQFSQQFGTQTDSSTNNSSNRLDQIAEETYTQAQQHNQ